MSGYFVSSRKRKGQAMRYGTGIYPSDSCVLPALFAGPGYTGVQEMIQAQYRLKQTTTSFRSGRDDKGEIQPAALLLKNQQDNQRASIFDNGHPFETRDERIFYSQSRVVMRGSGGSFYQGVLFGNPDGGPDLSWPSTYASTQDWSGTGFSADDITYGTRAMQKVSPDQSPAHLLQALVELKQDFPRVPFAGLLKDAKPISPGAYRRQESRDHSLTSFLHTPADETLNYFFGVQPTLQDLYQVLNAVIRAGKLIEQWRKDAGRVVRRSLHYDQMTTVNDSRSGSSRTTRAFGPCFLDDRNTAWSNAILFDGNEQVLVSRLQTTTDKYSFVGAFTYYIDPILDRLGPAGVAFNNAQHLLGLSADANTIWQLTPWTWLIDWFVNLGDCISLMNRIQDKSLVLKYGYLMRESELKTSLTVDHLTLKSGVTLRDIRTDYVIRRKVRIRSTPYGFGLNTQSFSLTQWAILAALGFTSGDKQLRYL